MRSLLEKLMAGWTNCQLEASSLVLDVQRSMPAALLASLWQSKDVIAPDVVFAATLPLSPWQPNSVGQLPKVCIMCFQLPDM